MFDCSTDEAPARIGVCAFRARPLSADEAPTQGAARQHARSVSLGAVLACGSDEPTHQLALALPHLCALERLAEGVLAAPEYAPVRAYVDKFKYAGGKVAVPPPLPANATTLTQLAYDPVTYFCAVNRFLGPLLPPLIKALYVPRTRLLIYCPAPVERAAVLAYNLAEVVRSAALSVPCGGAANVQVRGMLTLHDMDTLQREAARDVDARSAASWIGWTADRVMTERTGMFDMLLDASDFCEKHAGIAAQRRRQLVQVVRLSDARPAPLRWSVADVSLFLELSEQERKYTDVLERNQHPRFDAWRKCERAAQTEPVPAPALPISAGASRWRYLGQDARPLYGFLLVLLAYLRYWLAEWWLVRSQLRVVIPSAFILPIAFRGEGGLLDTGSDESQPALDQSIDQGEHAAGGGEADPGTEDAASAGSSESELDPFFAASGAAAASPLLGTSAPRVHREFHRTPSRAQERSIFPTHPRLDPLLAPREPFETLVGVYLFTLWSSWIRALHVHASAYLGELADPREPGAERQAPRDADNDTSPLLPDERRTVTVRTRDFTALGLRATDPWDERLVRCILAQWDGVEVAMATRWARFRLW